MIQKDDDCVHSEVYMLGVKPMTTPQQGNGIWSHENNLASNQVMPETFGSIFFAYEIVKKKNLYLFTVN